MSGIVLRILSICGIVLLAVLALAVAMLLLLLFFPVTYRICGRKEEAELSIRIKVKWLFGFVRVNYLYPEPGRVIARILWLKLYDARIPSDDKTDDDSTPKQKLTKKEGERKTGKKKPEDQTDTERLSDGENPSSGTDSSDTESSAENSGNTSTEQTSCSSPDGDRPNGDASNGNAPNGAAINGAAPSQGKISQKVEKIKYTICGIYDKIKEIWENISYYTELLRQEDTKLLFSGIQSKLCIILKSIRPRRLKADILFGTGAPDTTGYLFGAYCMLASVLGQGFWVTPDFDRAVFNAEFDLSGRITVWVLLVNLLRILLDKKLKRFIGKMKAGKKDRPAA